MIIEQKNSPGEAEYAKPAINIMDAKGNRARLFAHSSG